MKAKIDVYRKKEPLNHQWSKFEVDSEEKDKYDIYFKNRYYSNDAYEEYKDLDILDDDYIAFQEYEDKQGNMFSYWSEDYPDTVSFTEGSLRSVMRENEYPYISLTAESSNYTIGIPYADPPANELNNVENYEGNYPVSEYFGKEKDRVLANGQIEIYQPSNDQYYTKGIGIKTELPPNLGEGKLPIDPYSMRNGTTSEWFDLPLSDWEIESPWSHITNKDRFQWQRILRVEAKRDDMFMDDGVNQIVACVRESAYLSSTKYKMTKEDFPNNMSFRKAYETLSNNNMIVQYRKADKIRTADTITYNRK